MSLELEAIVINAVDSDSLGRWWATALGWDTQLEDDGDRSVTPPTPGQTPLLFIRVPEAKPEHPNRLHLDFRPDDRDAEVQRLLDLGARHADVGQGEQTWIVLADPEGNEFCVLGSK